MTSLRMQPTFRLEVPGPRDQALTRLRAALRQGDLGRHADAAGACLDFRVPPDRRRTWSPHLSVQLSEEEGRVELFGRFSPRPEVWTFVMMLYFGAAFLAFVGAVWGASQLTLGATPWAFLAAPVGVAGILLLHLVSMAGQRLSADQMVDLRDRLDAVLNAAFVPNDPTESDSPSTASGGV